MVCPRNSSVPS